MGCGIGGGERGGYWSLAHSGTRLRCPRGEADGLGGIRGPPEARWCYGFEQRGSGQESYAAMVDGGARECGRGCYGMGMSKTKEGKWSGAHSEFVGGLIGLGEASATAKSTTASGG